MAECQSSLIFPLFWPSAESRERTYWIIREGKKYELVLWESGSVAQRSGVGWLNSNTVLAEAGGRELKVRLVDMAVHSSPVTLGSRQGVGGVLGWPGFGVE